MVITSDKPIKRGRGRPPGSKNKKTLERERQEREKMEQENKVEKSSRISKEKMPDDLKRVFDTLNSNGCEVYFKEDDWEDEDGNEVYGYSNTFSIYCREVKSIGNGTILCDVDYKGPNESMKVSYVDPDFEDKARVYRGRRVDADELIDIVLRYLEDYRRISKSEVAKDLDAPSDAEMGNMYNEYKQDMMDAVVTFNAIIVANVEVPVNASEDEVVQHALASVQDTDWAQRATVQSITYNVLKSEAPVEKSIRGVPKKEKPKMLAKSKGIKLKGHEGTFRVVKSNRQFTMLESEQYGDKAYNIILKGRKVYADDVDGLLDDRADVMKADIEYDKDLVDEWNEKNPELTIDMINDVCGSAKDIWVGVGGFTVDVIWRLPSGNHPGLWIVSRDGNYIISMSTGNETLSELPQFISDKFDMVLNEHASKEDVINAIKDFDEFVANLEGY